MGGRVVRAEPRVRHAAGGTTIDAVTTRPAVCATLSLDDAALKRLDGYCHVTITQAGDNAALVRTLRDSDGLLCTSNVDVGFDVFEAAPRLRVVSNVAVGFNNVDVDEATRRGIVVCNTPGVLSDAVADYTMMLILQLMRRAPEHAAFARDGRWSGGATPTLGNDLAGKTLGVVGFGRIGRALAQRAAAFGMRVVFCDMLDSAGDGMPSCTRCELDMLLRESDIVSLHVNLTPATVRLIGSEQLALMKPTAYLVNTSRGGVVDQGALIEALRQGRIAGAALDVLETEPPAPADPALHAPNLLVMPHVGSATVETRRAMLELAIENLLAVLRGETPPACVNPDVLPAALAR